MNNDNPWFPFGHAPSAGAPTLFCLPFAGGGASYFMGWRRALPQFTVVPVQYPGRETRLNEALPQDLLQLADELALALRPLLRPPYYLLGYSLGAKLAYAVCQRLIHLGAPEPALLIVAAHGAPDSPPVISGAADLPEAEFRDLVRQYGGMPEVVFQDPELAGMLLPILRSDMRLATQAISGSRLNCPVRAYAGRDDQAALPEAMAEWERFTQGDFRLRSFAGGHFFARSHPEFLSTLASDLQASQQETASWERLGQS